MARNLRIGRYYRECAPYSKRIIAYYYANKHHLIKIDTNPKGIIVYSYNDYRTTDSARPFVITDDEYVRCTFFSSQEENWYESDQDEFIIAYNESLELTDPLKHLNMKYLRDTSYQNVTKEDFLNG